MVTSAEHWPLPWYLRDYTGAGYHGQVPDQIDASIVIIIGVRDTDGGASKRSATGRRNIQKSGIAVVPEHAICKIVIKRSGGEV